MFVLPYKVLDTLRNAIIIPKREHIFEYNFMPLKLKIVLKDSLFLINIYMDLFLQGLLSINNSHVIVVIRFHFRSFHNSLNKRHLYILHTYLKISNYVDDKYS